MKLFLIIVILAMFSVFLACSMRNKTAVADTSQAQSETYEKNSATKNKMPVLVELFTSEGCSSCPPADKVLTRLENEQPNADAEIITLAMHVDYWDRLGWKDAFSSNFYSERQNGYGETFKSGSVYTPQMIVDGQKEFIGSNFGTAQNAVSEAAKNQKATIELAAGTNSNDQNPNLAVKISGLPAHENSNVWLVIAEDNLQTKVGSGENVGETLSHTSVARDMKIIGEINSTAENFEIETAYQLQPEWKRENLKFVVFVQGKDSKKIYGVNKKVLG